jgi:hypothetical protein
LAQKVSQKMSRAFYEPSCGSSMTFVGLFSPSADSSVSPRASEMSLWQSVLTLSLRSRALSLNMPAAEIVKRCVNPSMSRIIETRKVTSNFSFTSSKQIQRSRLPRENGGSA